MKSFFLAFGWLLAVQYEPAVACSQYETPLLPAPRSVAKRLGVLSSRTLETTTTPRNRLLGLRGGAGIGIKPIVAAKGITLLIGLQGCASYLFPESMLDGYQVPRTQLAKALHRLTGLSWLIFAIGSHLLVVEQQPMEKIVGVASVLYLLDGLRGLFLDATPSIVPPGRSAMLLILHSLVAYATLVQREASASIASLASQVFPLGLLMAGLPLIVAPSTACSSVWDIASSVTSADALIVRLLGFALTGLAAFVGSQSLFHDVSTLQSVGWGHLASGTAFCLTTLCITHKIDQLDMPKGPYYVWLMIYGVVLSALLPAS